MQRLGRKALVVLISTFAACTYGVVHDQITARLCLEYFTIAHPPLFHTNSITVLAFCWGVAATLGIGVLLGIALAAASQAGPPAPLSLPRVCRAVVVLLIAMAFAAMVAGLVGYALSRSHVVSLPSAFAPVIPLDRHDRFTAVWFAHCASYIVGLTGAAVVCFRLWRARGYPRVMSFFPRTPAATARAILLALITAYIIWARFGTY